MTLRQAACFVALALNFACDKPVEKATGGTCDSLGGAPCICPDGSASCTDHRNKCLCEGGDVPPADEVVPVRAEDMVPDLTCTTDDDCGRVEIRLEGERQCCESCGDDTANVAWLKEFENWCRTRPSDSACEPIQCGESVPGVPVCDDGTCVMRR